MPDVPAGFDWQSVSPYLDELLQLPEHERPAWLEALRSREPALAAYLEALVDEHRELVQQGFLERVPATRPFEPARAGDVIGAYRLLSHLGHGGMGTVWLAERNDGRFERRVAVKFLAVELSGAEGRERFKREGNILGRLAHANIAELMDAGVSSRGEPYLILEQVEGVPIDQYCDDARLGIEARIRLFLEVAAAVAYAHGNLVVHRDLKPSNVLVRHDGQVKLLDFGIARLLQEEQQAGSLLPQEARSALTPGYAAPEQVTGGALTTATDVYSLGVLLYVLLAGWHPAGAVRSATVLLRMIESEAPLLSEAPPAAPEFETLAARRSTTPAKLRRTLAGDLRYVVAKALKRNPQERYLSVSALAEDLQRYLENRPVQARPSKLAYRAHKFVRRNRAALAVGMLVLAASAAGIAGVVIGARTARAERDFANLELARSEATQDLDAFLLSDAAPSGKPFTVTDLLQRAEHIVSRERSDDPATHVALLVAIGRHYTTLDQSANAIRVLEPAYRMSRSIAEPSLRAEAACALAIPLANAGELSRAETLVEQSLRELPPPPQYSLARIYCLLKGAEVARQVGASQQAIARVRTAQELMHTAPFQMNAQQYTIEKELAESYRNDGHHREASAAFAQSMALLTEMGRDDTQEAGTLLNNWGVSLNLLGRPLDAERVLHRAIDISRDNRGEETVSPMLLINYSRALRDLGKYDEAADYAERGFAKAEKAGFQVAANQGLLMRARIYRDRRQFERSAAMLDKVEPRLRRELPPGHIAFAVVDYERGLLAQQRGDLDTAFRDCDRAVAAAANAVQAGKQGRDYLPNFLLCRSETHLALGRPAAAAADSARAVSMLQEESGPGVFTSKLGFAYLASARALRQMGKSKEAEEAYRAAIANLQDALGSDHPDLRRARQLAVTPPDTSVVQE